MNCILPRTARKTDFGTLSLLSCLSMTALMSYFVSWCSHSRDSNGYCYVIASWVPYRGWGGGGLRLSGSRSFWMLYNSHDGARPSSNNIIKRGRRLDSLLDARRHPAVQLRHGAPIPFGREIAGLKIAPRLRPPTPNASLAQRLLSSRQRDNRSGLWPLSPHSPPVGR